MSIPRINKTLIERLKTAIIFAIVVFAAGFTAGTHYEHGSALATQHAIETAVHQATSK